MARLKRGGLVLEEGGVSDVLAVAFMFLIVVFAGVLLHGYRLDAIGAATDRQLQLKAEYLYRTLELAQVENFSSTYLWAIAENLLEVSEPAVPGDYLRGRVENLLEFYCSDSSVVPSNCAVMLRLSRGGALWEQFCPADADEPEPAAKQFTFSGEVTVLIAGAAPENRMARADAVLVLFSR